MKNKRIICFKIISCLISLLLLTMSISCNKRIVIGSETKPAGETETQTTPAVTPDGRTDTPATTPVVTPDGTTDTPPTTPAVTPDGTTDTPATTPAVTPDTPPTTPTPPDIPSDEPYVLKETKDGGLDYQNRIIFLGDSTSYGLKPYKMLPGEDNTNQVWYGNVGATIALFNVKTAKITAVGFSQPMTISKALESYKPDILVLKLGINGISTLDEAAFKEYYGWVIDEVFKKSPDTKLICQAIYPIASTYKDQIKINNAKVQSGNNWIKELVGEKYSSGYRCYYLDSYDIFLDENGYLDLKYENGGDGIHFNALGYKLALEYIRTHMIPD